MPTNRIGLTKKEYQGLTTTLCSGCGHNSITSGIISACYDLGIHPHQLAKLSGIGCSSKTPAYFMNRSHGFNAVHGRMPSIATGVEVANRTLINLGISGDGDSASIGMGQFIHAIRRNTNLVYIIENNGTYGLTKGQFSATADYEALDHYKNINKYQALDLVELAIICGATFAARSFSGDRKQMEALIKAAIAHNGCAILDIISPCVTFNDHKESTKGYEYMKEHDVPLEELGFVPSFEEIKVDYQPGEVKDIELHDGSHLLLKKLKEEYDPTDRKKALETISKAKDEHQVLTGLVFFKKNMPSHHELLKLPETPLKDLTDKELKPSHEDFATLIKTFN
ncbi:MAG: 2-oxoacid:ferredoxin oxidoreductase subunit beta [Deltaproteobacteria bacterium]|nr:2-oxoacid:ferredoxin oxidoreductase subunit beta [Deltaproteobacteria bacterium]